MSLRWPLACCIALFACEKKSPPAPPVVEPPASTETVHGAERIAWDQRAADRVELSAIRYAIYVDNVRSELASVVCAASQSANGFECSTTLPALSPGAHTLELASFVVDGTLLESPRSSPLRVNVVAASNGSAVREHVSARDGDVIATTGGDLRLQILGDALAYPTDLSLAPDGRLFVAERDGLVRTFVRDIEHGHGDRIVANGRLIAMTIDPQFAVNHFVYVVFATSARSGRQTFTLARFREVSGTFGDRVVLLDNVPAASLESAAALRFGPDDKMYVAFDDGGNAQAAGDFASLNGKILRLNADGTTPADQPDTTPLFSHPHRSPRGMAWDTSNRTLWILEGPAQLAAITSAELQRNYILPPGTDPSAIAVRGSDLFVASPAGRCLLHVQLGASGKTIAGSERLLQERIGPIRTVAIAPDGSIYAGADHLLIRLKAVRGRE